MLEKLVLMTASLSIVSLSERSHHPRQIIVECLTERLESIAAQEAETLSHKRHRIQSIPSMAFTIRVKLPTGKGTSLEMFRLQFNLTMVTSSTKLHSRRTTTIRYGNI